MAEVMLDGTAYVVEDDLAKAILREVYRRRQDGDLTALIRRYYERRGLVWPDTMAAMAFAETELAEAWELVLAAIGGWVRNHPEKKMPYDPHQLARELGQAMMMCQVAGMVSGVNPMEALVELLRA